MTRLVRVMLLLLVVGGCSHAQGGQPMILPVDAEPLVIATKSGDVSIGIEIAKSRSEHERGLMFRPRLPANRGMLFVMNETDAAYFWMKNTPEPLDLLFIKEDGMILTIKRGEALSEAVISSGGDIRFVLELAAGEAGRLHIAPGDIARHREIAAVKQAG